MKMKLNIQMFNSTNKTTNYELSQFIGTDKPTFLGDYNSDMGKIDNAIHTNATAISGASSDISLINNNIGTLSSLDTTDKTSVVNAINEVKGNATTNATNIGTLSNLETTNKTTVVNAINELVNARGTLLWTNSTPTAEFLAQTIQLDLSNYDELEIIYYTDVNANEWKAKQTTGRIPIENDVYTLMGQYIFSEVTGSHPQLFGRYYKTTSSGVQFEVGRDYNGSSVSTRNYSGVPLYIIGHKTNIFN